MSKDYSYATLSDEDMIVQEVLKVAQENLQYNPTLAHVDPEAVRRWVLDALHLKRVIMHGQYMVIFCVCPLWYTQETYLFEDVVLRMPYGKGGDLRRIPAILEEIARVNNCKGVIAGDMLSGRMSSIYQRAGYSAFTKNFLMEL